MAGTEDISFGEHVLRVQAQGNRFVGIVLGNIKDRYAAATRRALIERLRQVVLSREEGFVGLDGARARFVDLFPGGFADPRFVGDRTNGQLGCKTAVRRRVAAELPLEGREDLPDAEERALSLYRASTMIDPYTKTAIRNVLRGPSGRAFLAAVARFARTPDDAACAAFVAAGRKAGAAKWTALTYLPFFWQPGRHMFLKPTFTRDHARRIGHRFAVDYEPTPNAATYASLLDMAAVTHGAFADLDSEEPDNIVIHSVMWAKIIYRDGTALARP